MSGSMGKDNTEVKQAYSAAPLCRIKVCFSASNATAI